MTALIKKITLLSLCLALMALMAAPAAYAQTDPADDGAVVGETDATGDETTGDETTGEEVEEGPAFNNPAQAAKAENLAEAAAAASAEENQAAVDAAEQDVDDAQAAVDAAQQAIDEAPEDLSEEEQAALDQALADAQQALDDAQQTADDTLANAASVDASDIADMRAAGMGWGEIAQELGVHPGTLGLGHQKQAQRRAEVASRGVGKAKAKVGKPTDRDVKSGVSKTPGANKGNSSKSTGLGAYSDKSKGGSKGNSSNASSKSSSKSSNSNGNKGGNGKGNGKNK